MIIVKLMGGHSNQLFQYATGRNLAYKLGVPLKLDLSWYNDYDGVTTKRYYELGCYSLKATIATEADLAKVVPADYSPKLGRKLTQKLLGRAKIRTINESFPSLVVDKRILTAPNNTYLLGFWQNEGYFKDIRGLLLKEIDTTTPLTKKNRKYLEQINNCESVSLHIRREDYVSNPEYNKVHGTVSMEYYQEAIKKVSNIHASKNLHLFVFSPAADTTWCQKNLRFDFPFTLITGNKNGSDDMNLMKHCKHNIMANSSFSWWGAWLNQNPNKTVIAPKVWFQDKESNKQLDIIPRTWTRI